MAGNNPNTYAYVKDVHTWVDVFGLDIFNPVTWKAPSSGTGNTYKVFQQNIDFDRVDNIGRTNLEKMSMGRAPIGSDDRSINLHHSKQRGCGPLFELSGITHSKYGNSNALHPYKLSGDGQHPFYPVDRRKFDNVDRPNYWKDRARMEKERRVQIKDCR